MRWSNHSFGSQRTITFNRGNPKLMTGESYRRWKEMKDIEKEIGRLVKPQETEKGLRVKPKPPVINLD